MEISNIIPHIEALIFASDKPLTSLELTELTNNALGFMEDKITLDQVESAVEGIIEKYREEFYSFEMRESGGGWQFLTKKEYHKTVAQLNGEKFLKRLSLASMETLAIIAYKQPITKGEIEDIRGVNSDYSIQKLLEKELVIITGRNEELPGKPLVYATSKSFMDYFGINSAGELPQIREIISSPLVEPTMVNLQLPFEGGMEREKRAEADKEEEGEPREKGVERDNEEERTGEREEGVKQESIKEEKVEDEVVPLVIRGNSELIEETYVVNEGTEVISPDTVIDPEDSLNDKINKRLEEETKQGEDLNQNEQEDK